jgi:L-ascorbate metabolism protein UlaG (beta-lactamase superfamily)
MNKCLFLIPLFIGLIAIGVTAQMNFKTDVLKTSRGDLEITFIGHASLMFRFEGKVIHVDPFSRMADYAALPKADIILVTHDHRDHLDPEALKQIRTEKTILVIAEACSSKIEDGVVMRNGEVKTFEGLKVKAIPAYNLVHMRSEGVPYHPKGKGNGYVITFGDKRIYVAGDTENIPEMRALKNIDCAFLPMNLPYTMSPEMVVDAARAFKPRILYPYHYHFGETDTAKLEKLMQGTEGVELRIKYEK